MFCGNELGGRNTDYLNSNAASFQSSKVLAKPPSTDGRGGTRPSKLIEPRVYSKWRARFHPRHGGGASASSNKRRTFVKKLFKVLTVLTVSVLWFFGFSLSRTLGGTIGKGIKHSPLPIIIQLNG